MHVRCVFHTPWHSLHSVGYSGKRVHGHREARSMYGQQFRPQGSSIGAVHTAVTSEKYTFRGGKCERFFQ